MKIAFLISSLNPGGAERVVSLLSNEFVKKNDVLIVTINKYKPFYKLNDDIKIVSLKEEQASNNVLFAIVANINIIFKLFYIYRKYSIKRLYCFLLTSNILGVISGKIMGLDVIISERENPYIRKIKYWDFLRKILYRYADRLIVQTEGSKKYFTNLVNHNKIKIIPNPVKLKNVDLSIKEKIVLTVGRCDSNKNQSMIINAFSKVDSSWKLIICGDGPKLNELKVLVKTLKISNRVDFTGYIKNVDDYYKKASIFAFSSLSEGFPNVILESMSYGCACITTDCDFGPSDIITNKKNGFLIPKNDNELYLKYLQNLIIDKEMREKVQHESLIAIKKYSLERISKFWHEIN